MSQSLEVSIQNPAERALESLGKPPTSRCIPRFSWKEMASRIFTDLHTWTYFVYNSSYYFLLFSYQILIRLGGLRGMRPSNIAVGDALQHVATSGKTMETSMMRNSSFVSKSSKSANIFGHCIHWSVAMCRSKQQVLAMVCCGCSSSCWFGLKVFRCAGARLMAVD